MIIDLIRAGEMKSEESGNPHVFTLELHQDDPAKCTSAKMRKFGLARAVIANRISKRCNHSQSICRNNSSEIR